MKTPTRFIYSTRDRPVLISIDHSEADALRIALDFLINEYAVSEIGKEKLRELCNRIKKAKSLAC